jgi:hypothetical protein
MGAAEWKSSVAKPENGRLKVAPRRFIMRIAPNTP